MAVTSKVFGLAQQSLIAKEVNLGADVLKVMMCTSTYVPNQDTHRYKSSVTNEITGTGYTAGGVTLTTPTITYDTATNTVKFTCDNPAWTTSTLTARFAVFYDSTPATDATRPLLCYWDFGADVSSTAATFTLTIAAAGLLTFVTA